MNLHLDKKVFVNLISEVSEQLDIKASFIEKDYWITLVLQQLSASQFSDSVVFKGDTSLSKGYKLINRFSEDVDIAVLNAGKMSGNQLKILIRSVQKDISEDLEEVVVDGITSKGSKFRKSVYQYPEIQKYKMAGGLSNSLIIEINSFANPIPYSNNNIQSMIGEFFQDSKQQEMIKRYGLASFSINILDKKQTLIEKLVSLIRFSFAKDPIATLSSKIRHFYDLYYLVNDPECKIFISTEDFSSNFRAVLEHDRKQFEEPAEWSKKSLMDSPLVTDFENLWKHLGSVYEKQLSVLAFSDIPSQQLIEEYFRELVFGLYTDGLSL